MQPERLDLDVLEGTKELAKEIFDGFEDQAKEDAKAFVKKAEVDLKRWTKLRAEKKLTEQDFGDLVQAKKALAEIHALTRAGLALTKLERLRGGLINLVIDKAFNLDSSVERARVCGFQAVWQGATRPHGPLPLQRGATQPGCLETVQSGA